MMSGLQVLESIESFNRHGSWSSIIHLRLSASGISVVCSRFMIDCKINCCINSNQQACLLFPYFAIDVLVNVAKC